MYVYIYIYINPYHLWCLPCMTQFLFICTFSTWGSQQLIGSPDTAWTSERVTQEVATTEAGLESSVQVDKTQRTQLYAIRFIS